MLGEKEMFVTPKPVELVQRIIELASDRDSIVLDAFAGSGVTGHAVLQQNKADQGSRRFVQVEIEAGVASSITHERLRCVIDGYSYTTSKGKKIDVDGLGGGFRYCTLDHALFDEAGNIHESVKFSELAAHVFFTETGSPIPKRASGRTPLLGVHEELAVYLLYNGVLGDKRINGGNVLTSPILRKLPKHKGPRVIYGEGCRLGRPRLKREGIVFRQVPYGIKVS